MSNCTWGYSNCLNVDEKCYLCTSEGLHLLEPKVRSFGLKKKAITVKDTGRMGSSSETKSFNQTKEALGGDTYVTGTPNSGAGRIKGDFQIKGLIDVMIELKTTTRKNLNKEPGKETFTIQKAWLEKLEREAKAENMEFQYLKFSFKESDDKFYAITENNQILDMIVTMKNDRLALKKLVAEHEVYKKRANLKDIENVKLKAEIDLLKAELDNIIEKNKKDL